MIASASPENRLLSIIRDFKSHKTVCGKGKVLNFYDKKSDLVLVLMSGVASLCRKSDEVIILTAYERFFFGVDFIFSSEKVDEYFVKCDTECLFFLISQKEFLQIVDQKDLWKDVGKILSTQVSCLLYRDAVLSGANVYETVRRSIQYLWELNEEYRRKISIYDFISKRFKSASRSSVHKIVKGLNDGGYVKTERGVIIEVKRLPHNF